MDEFILYFAFAFPISFSTFNLFFFLGGGDSYINNFILKKLQKRNCSAVPDVWSIVHANKRSNKHKYCLIDLLLARAIDQTSGWKTSNFLLYKATFTFRK